MAGEYHIDENDYADFSFEMLNDALLKEVPQAVSVGTVNAAGDYVELYDARSEDGDFYVTPTQAGANMLSKLFGVKLKAGETTEIESFDVESWKVAWMLGLPIDRPGLYLGSAGRGLSSCSSEELFQIALDMKTGDGRFVVGSSHSQNRMSMSEACELDTSKIIDVEDDALVSQTVSAIRGNANRVNSDAVTVVAEAYIKQQGHLIPVILKTAALGISERLKREEELQLSLEYAALKALKAHGVDVPNVWIVKEETGDTTFFSERFDRSQIALGSSYSMAQINAGKEMMHLDDLWVRDGHEYGIQPSEVIHEVASRYRNSGLNLEPLVTLSIFNKLIGNEDVHGKNWAFLSSVNEQGEMVIEPSPAYDILPYMMFNTSEDVIRESGLSGRSLKTLSPDDLASTQKFFSDIRESDPEMFQQAFRNAMAIRNEMDAIIKNELIPRDLISNQDYDHYQQYLASPIAGDKEDHGDDCGINHMVVEEVSEDDLAVMSELFNKRPQTIRPADYVANNTLSALRIDNDKRVVKCSGLTPK